MAELPGLERFDGDWENTQGQAFCIKDGIVTMGEVTQKILQEGDQFRLDQDTWVMKRNAPKVEWTKGRYTVSWTKVETDAIDELEFEMKKTATASEYKNLKNLMEKSKVDLDDDLAFLDEEEEEIEAAVPVAAKLEEGKIVPDVLPEAIEGMCTIIYGDEEIGVEVSVLTPTQTKDMPTVSWKGEDDAKYTVMMTDPDAIARDNPLFREFVHYAAVNVEGSEILPADSDVNVALKYAGPGPPYNSGLHRYVWLVYKQADDVDAAELAKYLEGRGGKKCDEWCKGKGMTLVAANYYEAEWDEQCDQGHVELGFVPPPPYQSPKQQMEAVVGKLKAGEIVPDILESAECGLVTVKYGDNTIGLDTSVLTPTQTKDMPTVSWDGADNTLYTVIMTDPDAISREKPLFREFVHYAAVNVTGSAISADSDVNVALQYAGPGPPCNSGLHRYVWLVYSQSGEVDASELSAYLEGRGGKKTDAWCKEKGMTLVGANYYEAEWDEEVDNNHKAIAFVPPPEYQSPKQQIEAAVGKLTAGEIVPDILESAECGLVTVTYGDNSIGLDTAVLTPTQTKDMPTVSWKGADDTLYTVIMTDPDAISREKPLFREFVHYAAVNVTGSEISADSDVNVALQYAGPGPPCNSGLHRYVWLVYLQAGEVDASELSAYLEGRGGKKTDAWCKEKGMTLVGANYYEAEWDEEVDNNHKAIAFVPPPEYQSPSQKAAAAEAAAAAAAAAAAEEAKKLEEAAAAAAEEVKEEEVIAAEDEVVDVTPKVNLSAKAVDDMPDKLGSDPNADEVLEEVVDDGATSPAIMLTQDSRDPAADAEKAKKLADFQRKLGMADSNDAWSNAKEQEREREMDPDHVAPKFKAKGRESALVVHNVDSERNSRSQELEVIKRKSKASRSIELFESMSGRKKSKRSRSRSPQPKKA